MSAVVIHHLKEFVNPPLPRVVHYPYFADEETVDQGGLKDYLCLHNQ